MEGFAALMKRSSRDMELGPLVVTLGRRDEDGDLTLDLLKLKSGRAYVAVAAGELGRTHGGVVFREHNTFVPERHRGHAYMKALYLSLLRDSRAVLVSDAWNHSPPMRRTWMALAREPGVYVFADDNGTLVNIAGAPYDSPVLDATLIACAARSAAEAAEHIEVAASHLGTDYGDAWGVDDPLRFATGY